MTKMNKGIKRISKLEACEKYLHCSPSTFDNYLKLSLIPPGHIKCLTKGIEMFEEMKESSRHEEYDERSRHRYGGMREDYDREIFRGEGRYGRY